MRQQYTLSSWLACHDACMKPVGRKEWNRKNVDIERRKVAGNTWLIRNSVPDGLDSFSLKYHDTIVATWHAYEDGSSSLIINSDGWRTPTTKERINWMLPRYVALWQTEGVWQLHIRGQGPDLIASYFDGIKVDVSAAGIVTVPNALSESEAKARRVGITLLRRRIHKYAKGYAKELFAGNVPSPDTGDCFYCRLGWDEDNPPGTEEHDHLMSHIDEKYYVPSLFVRATNVIPTAPIVKELVWNIWNPTSGHRTNIIDGTYQWASYGREGAAKAIANFLKLRLLGTTV